MFLASYNRGPYFVGFLVSCFSHILCVVLAIAIMEATGLDRIERQQVFTVTLDGGEKIGGVSQVPTEDPNKKPLPKVAEPAAQEEPVAEDEPVEEKQLESTAAVEDPEIALERKRAEEAKIALEKKKEAEKLKAEKEKERKAKEELEKKKKEEQRKKDEEKKKADEEKKKKDEEKRKKDEKEKKILDRKERDKLLQQAINRAENRYRGESANAGGEGFGAARIGGKGMGGGTLASLEFIAYRNRLEQHIKGGWRWLPGAVRLAAQIEVTILPDGTVQRAQVVASSGNATFDDSALRAVYKASPVPPAPTNLYDQFRVVRITFDSER